MISAFFAKINAGIAAIGMAVGGLLGLNPEPQIVYVPVEQPAAEEESLGADTVLPIAGAVYYLAGTGISSSATSFSLTSFTIPQNGKKIVDSELSDTFYVTFEPGNRSRQEIASCTTVAQNADDTATISGCTRGLSPVTPYTASTSLQFAHGGGSTLVFSNPPQLYNDAAMKGNDETITGQWTFSTFPITASTSIASETVSGISELATGGEAASSTLSGDIATSRLVLPTSIATSAAPTSGNVVVVTGDDGNIAYGFLPQISTSTVRTYTATTTSHVWTTPSRFVMIRVQAWGAGGGGGSDTAAELGGGGGGGYMERWLDANSLSASSSYTVTVGSGGAAVLNTDGNAGGNSSFDTLVVAYGGGGGSKDTAGSAGGGGGGSYIAGVSATAATGGAAGDVTATAGSSLAGGISTYAISGAGGGGCADAGGACAAGGNAVWGGAGGGGANNATASAGGSSKYGGAGGTGATGGAGTAGTAPGGGGGASYGGASGAGARGQVIITEYY